MRLCTLVSLKKEPQGSPFRKKSLAMALSTPYWLSFLTKGKVSVLGGDKLRGAVSLSPFIPYLPFLEIFRTKLNVWFPENGSTNDH